MCSFTELLAVSGTCQETSLPRAGTVFFGTWNAFGYSISSPDMSQSNYCQEMAFASSEFRGHRKRPAAYILL